jgi:hypothetical protein
MGDCDGPPSRYLTDEYWNNAATTPNNIAESDAPEAGGTSGTGGAILNKNLGDAFRRSHDAGWAHCFVGRNHHEAFRSVLNGKIGKLAGSDHIIQNRLAAVHFHYRDMLESGCVQYDFRSVTVEDARHIGTVSDISDYLNELGRILKRTQLGMNLENGVFVVIEKDHSSNREGSDLNTDFGAD